MSAAPMYYACIADAHGHIRLKLNPEPMTRDDAERFIKKHYYRAWLACNAIPQPVTHQYFKG